VGADNRLLVNPVSELLHLLANLDRALIGAVSELRWEPLTALLVLASAAFVKGPLIVCCGAVADVRSRRLLPLAAAAAGTAALLGAAASTVLKLVFERLRPPLADPTVTSLVATPDGYSFPSGHATTAFAAAAAVGVLHPRLRWPLLALAAVVGFSRVYLGVHWGLDVLAGAVLGIGIGVACALAARRIVRRRLAH
jgi:undecaprenyl-diphosphatase